jgi:large subunit ribosomal protein L29
MKPAKIRELSREEIGAKLNDLRGEGIKLRLARAKGELKNPLKLRSVRREIARLLTISREKGWK